MTSKESHATVSNYEQNKKFIFLGSYTILYNQINFGLNCFLISLFIFNIIFFFLLPMLSFALGEFVYSFIYAGYC
jgi:hypothetical protein